MASKNVVCVDSLANCDSVPPLHRAMRLRKDLLVVVCETFNGCSTTTTTASSARLSTVDSSRISSISSAADLIMYQMRQLSKLRYEKQSKNESVSVCH